MADFTTIKTEIDANIVPFNDAQEITGEKLNTTLQDLVDDINAKKSDPVTISQNTQTGKTSLQVGNGTLVEVMNGNGEALAFSLKGAGTTMQFQYLHHIKVGRKYRLIVVNPNYAHDEISSAGGISIFQLFYHKNNVDTVFAVVQASHIGAIDDYYDFTGIEADYYGITIRANAGEDVKFYLLDATDYDFTDVINRIDTEIVDINEVLPKNTGYVTIPFATPVVATYDAHSYYTNAGRLAILSNLVSPILKRYNVSKIKISINTGFKFARQLFSGVVSDISTLPIPCSDIELYNDSSWQTGTQELDLSSYPTAKTFGIIVRNDAGSTIDPATNTGLTIQLYANGAYLDVSQFVSEKIREQVQPVVEDTKKLYDLMPLGKSETPDYFDVTRFVDKVRMANYSAGHYYVVTDPSANRRGAVTSFLNKKWLKDHEASKIKITIGPAFKFSRQIFQGVSSTIEAPTDTLTALYDDTAWQTGTQELDLSSLSGYDTFGIYISRVDGGDIDYDGNFGLKVEIYGKFAYESIPDYVDKAIENASTKGGELGYIGDKVNLQERSYSKSNYMTTSSDALTTIKAKIVTAMGHSLIMQSCATFGKYFVRAYQYGGIAIYDLEAKTLVANFMLPLADSILETIHASNVSFGVEYPTGNTTFPAFYVCETTGLRRCFVFNLTLSGATLLQTITFDGTWGTGNDYRDFIVDRQNREMWVVGYYNYGAAGNYTILKKVPLKPISLESVSYDDDDVITSFDLKDVSVLQGIFIWNSHMFIADQRRWIVNVDLIAEAEVGHIDFSSFMGELEGITNYDGTMLVDNSTIYQLKLY